MIGRSADLLEWRANFDDVFFDYMTSVLYWHYNLRDEEYKKSGILRYATVRIAYLEKLSK